MNIKVDLENKIECDGCPCLVYSDIHREYHCTLGYDIKHVESFVHADYVKRDPKCIKEHGV